MQIITGVCCGRAVNVREFRRLVVLSGAFDRGSGRASLLITAAVREALDARLALQELPAAAVAGISEPVVTYAVEGVLSG